MFKTLIALAAAGFGAAASAAGQGPITLASPHGVDDTVARLTAAIESKGAKVVAVVDHGAAAGQAGLELPPTKLVIFGNPKLGTPLMQSDRLVGLDLPMKMLIWADEDGTKISYWDPKPLADHYALAGRDGVLETMSGALAGFARAASAEE